MAKAGVKEFIDTFKDPAVLTPVIVSFEQGQKP
jgi:hypothetical protein